MPKRPLTNKDGEVRPLTAEDFKHFRPIAEVDPGMIEAAEQFRRRGRPVIGDAPKLHIGFRLAADVVNARRSCDVLDFGPLWGRKTNTGGFLTLCFSRFFGEHLSF